VPLAVSLRRAWPQASIAWLIQDSFADAVRSHPAVDETVLFPRSRWRRWWDPRNLATALRWLGALRGRFDLVVDAQGLGRSGLMAWSTRAGRRIGFADAREGGWLGLNERYDIAERHAVDRMVGLVAAAGVPPIRDLRLYAPPEAVAWWREDRARRGLGRYAVFAPTSRWASKAWPAERWGELAGRLLDRGLDGERLDRIAYVGGGNERVEVAAALPREAGAERCLDLAGATNVGQLMAVIAEADLVVANDSAALHMAVGFGRPLLALFGPTDPTLVGPYGREDAVLRSAEAERFTGHYRDRSLGDRLMRGIAVGDVLAALDAGRHQPVAVEVAR
jgi:ADP-heptose:LPS heptosyltransferase